MRKSIKRFSRYASVGVSTFALDLAMLYVLVQWFEVSLSIATPCSFLVAVSLNYTLSRAHVFKGSGRSWHMGYAYFLGVALIGAAATTGIVEFLVAKGLYFIVARIIAAGIVGVGNYLFNLHVNFKVAGKH